MDIQNILSAASLYLRQGGYVLYPLLGISLWMWYLIVRKLLFLWSRNGLSDRQTVSEEYQDKHTSDSHWNRRLLLSLVRRQQQESRKHVQTVFILAAAAPLLGLLGTVTGMISTFESISRFGTTNVRGMAAGISEALITTQIGLVVAIPGLFMGHFLRRRTDALQMRLERFYKRMVNGESEW